MRFRIISAILALCLFSALFVGCNSGVEITDGSESQSETSTETKKPTSKPKETTPPIIYDKEEPENPADIPDYNGEKFDFENILVGQQSVMNVVKRTDEAGYRKYLAALETAGYEFYADNKIGDNLFATYINDTHIVNVSYIKVFEQVRVTVDDRSIFGLPGLASENQYEDTADCSLTLLSDTSVRWPGRMGYVYKLADGSFFIIDGGYTKIGDHGNSSQPYIMSVLEKYADDPNDIRVAAWLITHVHEDHFGGFVDMSRDKDVLDRITVEKIIYNSPSLDALSEQSENGSALVSWGRILNKAIEAWEPESIIKAHPGQVFHLRNLKLTIYHSHELLLYSRLNLGNADSLWRNISVHNNTSIVSMVDFMDKSALYLADSSAVTNTYVLDPVYGTAMDCDIVQVAHHGYGDTSAGNIYKHITPEIVFWPVCKGHYDGKNNDGSIYYENGGAYNGVVNVGFNKKYLMGEGVVHYYHGEECVSFENFETWEGVRWDCIPEAIKETEKSTEKSE